jgi:hypothetical protein
VAVAQDATGLVARAVSAYQSLELDAAAGMLRRALTPPLADSLGTAERARALSYLGAIEVLREHRDSAAAVFRRLVLLDPRYRADTFVFPPEVTRLFDEVRLRTRVVAIRVPDDTVVPVQQGWFSVWLFPSAPHDVTVAIAREDGRPLRTLYAGPLGDSLRVRWDGRDSTGAIAPRGPLWLTVASRAGSATERLAQRALEFDVALDTVAHRAAPGPDQLLPERANRGTAMRSLAGGLLIGAAAISLPQIVAPGERPSGTRLVVGGTLALSGLVGYLVQPAGRPLPDNAATNRARREDWRRRTDSIIAENARRQQGASFRVRSAGHPVVIEQGGGARAMTRPIRWATLPLAAVCAAGYLAAQTRVVSAGAAVIGVRSQGVSGGGVNRSAGTVLGGVATAQFGRLELEGRYIEGVLQPQDGASSRREFVQGELAVGYRPAPWLATRTAARGRAYVTPAGTERWLTWLLGVRVEAPLIGTTARGDVELWRALALSANVGSSEGGSGRGGEAGITVELPRRPVWLRLAYAIDRSAFAGAARRETLEAFTLTVGVRRR